MGRLGNRGETSSARRASHESEVEGTQSERPARVPSTMSASMVRHPRCGLRAGILRRPQGRGLAGGRPEHRSDSLGGAMGFGTNDGRLRVRGRCRVAQLVRRDAQHLVASALGLVRNAADLGFETARLERGEHRGEMRARLRVHVDQREDAHLVRGAARGNDFVLAECHLAPQSSSTKAQSRLRLSVSSASGSRM